MDISFNSLEELYRRLKPALSAKRSEMKRSGYIYATEEDIWNYLKEEKWKNSNNLSLYDMTSDIFDIDNSIIDDYLRTKMNVKNRKMYFNNED